MTARIYVASPGFEQLLINEFSVHNINYEQIHPQLFYTTDCDRPLAWPVNIWYDVQTVSINSINHAAEILRNHAPYWNFFPLKNVRRCQLIQDKLLKIKNKEFSFPLEKPIKARSAFCLLDNNTLLFATNCSRPYVDGRIPFLHDRINPPARAYLKIWEALTLLQEQPTAGEKVLELGAAPGAWTWCLAALGAEVHSVDRAALDPRIDGLSNVHHRQCDAFALDSETEACDWLCSDLICYPQRLIELIEQWNKHGHCQRYVITIKFQGEVDFAEIQALQAMPHAWLCHLANNKHELCYIQHPKITSAEMGAWKPQV